MTPQTRRDVARLLCHVYFDPDRFEAERQKETDRLKQSAVNHLRQCLREVRIMDKYSKIREALLNAN